jgi:enterobactin synthetase component D
MTRTEVRPVRGALDLVDGSPPFPLRLRALQMCLQEPDRGLGEEFHSRSELYRMALGPHPIAVPDAFVLPFETAAFVHADFVRYGIACPSHIQRSVVKRQAEYLAGRRTAVAALREQDANALDLAIGPRGAPTWPQGFVGSISHTDGVAAAVALRSHGVRGVGIDIEHIATATALEAIRATVVDAAECKTLFMAAEALGWPSS